MNDRSRCPVCRTELPASAPEGLCPKCLLQAGIKSEARESGSRDATAPFAGASGFVPPAPAALAALFPHLEILELLGQGGMGVVYKARQPGLDRLVALKTMPPVVAADPAFAERFTREARALAKLNHPNIVGVYDFGQAAPVADAPGSQAPLFFFLMEYVDGVNLRQAIQRGDLRPAEALRIVPQICDALQFAHDEGIVHRDIKPENILLDKRGRVKIADFGLAKLLGVKTDFALTGTRQVMGTPHYMAPEQIQGTRDVDHRADIYSLGVTFYEMLTGELPLGRFPVPSKKVQIDVRLDDVVLRTLEVQPEQRYQRASEVKTEIEQIANGPAAKASPPNPAAAATPAAPNRSPRRDLERVIADLLPDDKTAAIRTYRQASGAELPEALSAVKAIAQKHDKNAPAHFPTDLLLWGLAYAVAAVAGGFWLATTQDHLPNRIMFQLGGGVLALLALAMQVTAYYSRMQWRLSDFDEDETAPETKDLPPPGERPAPRSMELVIADLLPEEKVAAVRVYRQVTGAGLAEAVGAVKEIAQKHGKDKPLPFNLEHLAWCIVWAAGALAGGFWLAETQANDANRLLFRLGGFVLALFAVVSQVTWRRNLTTRWRLEDFEDEDTAPTSKAQEIPVTDKPGAP